MALQADPDLMARYMKALQRRTGGDTQQDNAAETPQQPRSPDFPLRPQSKEPLLHSQSQERPDLDTAVIRRPQPEVPVPTYSHEAHSPPTSYGALPAATPVAVTNNYVNGDMNIHQQDQHNYQADGKRHNTTNADDATGRPGLLGRLGDFAGFLLRHWRMAISAVLLCLLSPANRKLCLNEEYRLIARNIPRVADLCAGLPSSTAVLGDAAFPPFCRTFPAIKGSHVSTSVAAIAREIVVLGDMELADVAKGDGVWKNVFTDTHRIDRNLRRTNEAYEKQRTTTYRALHRLNRRIKIEIARMEEPVSGWYAWTPDWLAVLWTGRRDQAVTLNLLDELESLAMDARTQRKAHWDDLHASGLGAGDFDAGDFDAVVGDLRSFATDIAVEKKSLAVRGDADGDHDGDDEDVEKRRAAADPSEAGVGMVRQVMLDVSAAHSAFLVSLDREIHHLGELIEMTIPTLRGKGRDAYGKRQVPKKIADICAIETALVSHVPLHEQPPTFFELLGLDPYNQPFSPPGSSTQRGAAGAAKAAAAEKLIKEAWLRLVEDVDKTYISVEIIGERGARESTESGVTQFISYKDVRSKVKLERLSADTEALRRLYNQVAQLLLDPGFRSTYMHYLMPGSRDTGEQLYKSEIKKDLQQGWVHNRRAKMGEVCGWDEGDGQK
ncbi:hypothetical protein CGCF415_v013355 [Colletotrichum fructicola]|nr:hypothetical protein CGCF415_v013355 [Colletotrichum fructicola]KAF4924443.1 hypothetical protein CGCF245_v014517 [Colletotrichum fructicola]KAF5482905.1 hypothetical protein CGCF413_v015501 [Colletotrichum fructicola]